MRNTDHILARGILKILEVGAASTIDVAWAMTTNMSESSRRLRRLGRDSDFSPGRRLIQDLKEGRRLYLKHRYYLRKLEEQGLVRREGTHRTTRWRLTKDGKEESRKKEKAIPIEVMMKPGGVTIVSYDIPESLHRERDGLREMLQMMGFRQVHQSLWKGVGAVTSHFVEYLKEKSLLEHVHIFEVLKIGTIE